MDGSSVEHSDSDSGESWTLLENNSIYADDPPEFIESEEKHEAHHDKDEDTDGISIISDSDHEAPTPPPGESVHEKLQFQSENNLSDKDISDFVSVDPHQIDNKEHEPAEADVFIDENHVKHKTYVHRRNKQLSTILNIIVLGSVVTAAGMAIGHMWGAKNDCTMQTTSSINKILSNLYKLQEENAYLRSKLKELTSHTIHHNRHQRIPLRNNKCKKVFEESLSNIDPRKITKCIDINNKDDNLIEHMTTPKFEKEFIADMDKLKSVYLQNKSWLDDEISRRMKIEEQLLKKYNDEVNSSKEQKQESAYNKNSKPDASMSKPTVHKVGTLENVGNIENFNSYNFKQNKVSYADSLKSEKKPKLRRNEERYDTDEYIKDSTRVVHSTQEQKEHPQLHENQPYAPNYVNYLAESVQDPRKIPNKQFINTDKQRQKLTETDREGDFTEIDDDIWSSSVQEPYKKPNKQFIKTDNLSQERTETQLKGDFGGYDYEIWASSAQEPYKKPNKQFIKTDNPSPKRTETQLKGDFGEYDHEIWSSSAQEPHKKPNMQFIKTNNLSPERIKTQLRGEFGEYDNEIWSSSAQEPHKKPNTQFINTNNLRQKRSETNLNGDFAEAEADNWSKTAQETKNKRKKEKRSKKRNAKKLILEDINDQNNSERPTEFNVSEEEFMKDDRYFTNKLNKEKKKNGYINSNKKQKGKNKIEKWNTKGEFGDKFEAIQIPEDFAFNYLEKNRHFDIPSPNSYDSDGSSETIVDKVETLEKKTIKEPSNWFEKRAVFRKEARKKFYEQFGDATLNNSSWYFRRMRKREQCRTGGDNTMNKKYRKEKKYDKIKQ